MADDIIEITSENFDEKVLNSSIPVLIDFWAEWCGPCKQLMPTIEKVALDYKGKALIGKVNVDNERDIAAKYNVRGIPTMLLFKNGQLKGTKVGVTTKSNIVSWIKENI